MEIFSSSILLPAVICPTLKNLYPHVHIVEVCLDFVGSSKTYYVNDIEHGKYKYSPGFLKTFDESDNNKEYLGVYLADRRHGPFDWVFFWKIHFVSIAIIDPNNKEYIREQRFRSHMGYHSFLGTSQFISYKDLEEFKSKGRINTIQFYYTIESTVKPNTAQITTLVYDSKY